jgi:Predicted GTPase
VLLHLIYVTGDEPVYSYNTICKEIKAYGGGLSENLEIISLTICNTCGDVEAKWLADELKAVSGHNVMRFPP